MLLGVTLAVSYSLQATRGQKPLLTDTQLFELKVGEALSRAQQRASDLAHEGKHLEAASLLVEIAGSEKRLITPAGKREEPSEPLLTEKMALMQFTLAHKRESYVAFLKAIYPTWDSACGPTNLEHREQTAGPGVDSLERKENKDHN